MIRDEFKGLLEEILKVPQGTLSDDASRRSVESWSSLKDLEILTAIFSKLGVDAQMIDYDTIGELLDFLERERAFGVQQA